MWNEESGARYARELPGAGMANSAKPRSPGIRFGGLRHAGRRVARLKGHPPLMTTASDCAPTTWNALSGEGPAPGTRTRTRSPRSIFA